LALAEAESGRWSDPERHRFAASDRVAETEPGAAGCGEMLSVLRLVSVGDSAELSIVAHLCGVAVDHEIKTVEGVAAGGEDAVRVSARLRALRSLEPVQKYNAPSDQAPNSGVTCGRPSGRTVDSQYT
jgi:hypothetical protein